MRLRLWRKRVYIEPYAATINFNVPSECDTVRVAVLTGALAFNIIDANAKDGDYFKLLVQADASARTVTIGGAQGAPGSIALLATGVACVLLTYHEGIGKYVATVTPT